MASKGEGSQMDFALPVIDQTNPLRRQIAAWRAAGLRIGFVPTMGALHGGHLSLVETALHHADRVVASIYVNPAQFAPHEDFNAYPRTFKEDCAMLNGVGAHLVYAPTSDTMYPPGYCTNITMDGPALGLESDARPHFFGGVATVVAKLFQRVDPDIAVFGEKDFQQLQVIKRLVADLDFAIEIIAGETRREADGLAMSSRNRRLSPQGRRRASALHAALLAAREGVLQGEAIEAAERKARESLLAVGFEPVDYVAIRLEDNLSTTKIAPRNTAMRILAAAHLDGVRLIDNIGFSTP
jgi:pantoate--beta-alanine ligase